MPAEVGVFGDADAATAADAAAHRGRTFAVGVALALVLQFGFDAVLLQVVGRCVERPRRLAGAPHLYADSDQSPDPVQCRPTLPNLRPIRPPLGRKLSPTPILIIGQSQESGFFV